MYGARTNSNCCAGGGLKVRNGSNPVIFGFLSEMPVCFLISSKLAFFPFLHLLCLPFHSNFSHNFPKVTGFEPMLPPFSFFFHDKGFCERESRGGTCRQGAVVAFETCSWDVNQNHLTRADRSRGGFERAVDGLS